MSLLKFIKRLLLFLLICALIIVSIRFINGRKTKSLETFDTSSSTLTFLSDFNREDYEKSTYSDLTITKIDEGMVQGYHFKPNNITKKQTIITFSGSDGGILYPQSILLAQNGYDVYGMYYYGQKNLPKVLSNVEITNFSHIMDYIRNEKKEKLSFTVIGGSKGAELSLLLANYYANDIENVVLYAPSAYMWEGLNPDRTKTEPSFLIDHKEPDYLSFSQIGVKTLFEFSFNLLLNKPICYRIFYDDILNNEKELSKYTIPLDNVKANVLMFAGEDDQMWNSAKMAQQIRENLKNKCTLYTYKNAGHLFIGPSVFNNLLLGGEYKANEQALEDSNQKLLQFLENQK